MNLCIIYNNSFYKQYFCKERSITPEIALPLSDRLLINSVNIFISFCNKLNVNWLCAFVLCVSNVVGKNASAACDVLRM